MKTISFFLIVLSFIYADSTVESSEDKNSTVKVDNVEVKELLLSVEKVKEELTTNDLYLKKFIALPEETQQDTLKILFKNKQSLSHSTSIEAKKMNNTMNVFIKRDIEPNPGILIIPIDNNDSNKTDKEKFEIFRKVNEK